MPLTSDLPCGTNAALVISSSRKQLVAILEQTPIEELRELHEQVAALEAVQVRARAAQEEILRTAEARLRIERKLGERLAQDVRRGRPRKSSDSLRDPGRTRLPFGINAELASWYRKLARVPEQAFEAYLHDRSREGKAPSARSLLKFSARRESTSSTAVSLPRGAKRESVRVRADPLVLTIAPDVLAAVKAFMDVDVVVGSEALSSAFPRARSVRAAVLKDQHVRGGVLMGECVDPDTWLPKLATARAHGMASQILVVLPADVAEPWFKRIEDGGWTVCFPRSRQPGAIAYGGNRTHAFWLTMQALGTVLRSVDFAQG